MATNTSICAICAHRHIFKSSTHWCPECEEALCSNCSEYHSISKASKSHKIVCLSQYQSLPSFVINIQQFCGQHKEKFKQYCMKHECPLCYKCITKHGKCNQVVPLEDVVSKVKTSEVFLNLEQSLEDILMNIKRIRDDRENNLKSIKNQKLEITMKIDRTITQINHQFNKLKDELMKELEQVYHVHNDRIQLIISSLSDQENEITNCSMKFENIRKYASDLQLFLGKKDIQSKIADNEKRLTSIIENESLKNIDIKLVIDDKILDILTSIKSFGSILTRESLSGIDTITKDKNKQAQMLVPYLEINRKDVKIIPDIHTIGLILFDVEWCDHSSDKELNYLKYLSLWKKKNSMRRCY
ncbi:unnamed protein product [Mytilus coruscus]|uniref:B box-type domain-containing protein n=1 Tax=Mytilus coruscus TaxID=42192 RepID=A0A6J8BGZ6_MYTCO|nr:unnamed protein product [Mytilus coruscus]